MPGASPNCAPARIAPARSSLRLCPPAGLRFDSDPAALKTCDFFIVTVPTPIDGANRPDLRALIGASETVGKAMQKGAIVVYESTVYPGCIEEDCVPVLERASGLKAGHDFTVGYSPERINPGDKNAPLRDHHQGGGRSGCTARSTSSPTSMARW